MVKTRTTENQARTWMSQHASAYFDKVSMTVNEAQLAEDAYEALHPEQNGFLPVPEVWYEYALMVAEEWQIVHGFHNYTRQEAQQELKNIHDHIYPKHSD